MAALEIVGKIIVAIGVLIVLGYLYGLLFSWISKSTNSNISYHGKTIYRPHYHDENMKEIAEAKEKILSNAKLLIGRVKSLSEKKMSTAEKIKALKDLEELKSADIITNEEYEILRSKLV